MTDIHSISTEPRNKSFDENIKLDSEAAKVQKEAIDNLGGLPEKVCFNPYCSNKGSRWIEIIGTAADYRDHKIPYCVCEECFLPFVGWGPGRDHNESLKSIPELKICYYHLCYNEGKHWIDIYRSKNPKSDPDQRWLGAGVGYQICEKCYAFFEYKRKDIYLLYNTIWGSHIKLEEENRTGITVRDFCSLLESSRSDQGTTTKNRSNMPFTGQVYEHKFTTQE